MAGIAVSGGQAVSAEADLFGASPEPITVMEDEQGGVRYWAPRLDAATQQQWLQHALQDLAWHGQRRQMYDRMLDVPRLMATVSLRQPDVLPAWLQQAHALIQSLVPAPYTHVGCNCYRDRNDSVAMHHDRTEHLRPGHPIVLLSLGAGRDLMLKPLDGHRRSQRIHMEPGSVLAMSHRSQFTHLHGIPKCRHEVGIRVSLAFRARLVAD